MQLHQRDPLAHGSMPLLLEMQNYHMSPMQALNVSKQRPLTAALVDGLELGPLLARGSFGSVFRGRFKGQKVAVKVRSGSGSICIQLQWWEGAEAWAAVSR